MAASAFSRPLNIAALLNREAEIFDRHPDDGLLGRGWGSIREARWTSRRDHAAWAAASSNK